MNGIGATLTKYKSVPPQSLFDIAWGGSHGQLLTVTPKEYYANIELLPWDLKNYGTAWKFIVTEVDPSQSFTESYTNTTTYASNFDVNLTVFKIGAKFGNSGTSTGTSTWTLTTTVDSDPLGDAVLTFDQPVVISHNYNSSGNFEYESGKTREISTGDVSLSIEPQQIF